MTELVANGVDGLHLYSMNNPATAEYILNGLKPLLGVER
jgi:hypothetical protein